MVVHAFNPSTWEAEAGGFPVSGTEKPCLEKQNKTKQNKMSFKRIRLILISFGDVRKGILVLGYWHIIL